MISSVTSQKIMLVRSTFFRINLRSFRLKCEEESGNFFFSNAASNATLLGVKSSFFTNSHASRAPCSRSMPPSSHSTLRGPGVAGVVQGADDFLKVHRAAARRAEVPTAARVAEVKVAGQNAGAAVEERDRIFHVHVIDAIREGANEFHRVDALPEQMAGIEVEAEFFAVVERFEARWAV